MECAFWDTHDLSDFWNKTKDAYFDVEIKAGTTYCAVDKKETNNKSEDKPWK